MRKPVVLLDVDGVIADFAGYYTQLASEALCKSYPAPSTHKNWRLSESLQFTEREHTRVEHLMMEAGRASSIKPYPYAIDAVKGLFTIADVVFVTSPIEISPTWVFDRQSWLVKHFGTEHARAVHTYYKQYVNGDFLIDDKPANIRKWKEATVPGTKRVGLLWGHTFNTIENDPTTEGMLRVYCWSEVREAIKEFSNDK